MSSETRLKRDNQLRYMLKQLYYVVLFWGRGEYCHKAGVPKEPLRYCFFSCDVTSVFTNAKEMY